MRSLISILLFMCSAQLDAQMKLEPMEIKPVMDARSTKFRYQKSQEVPFSLLLQSYPTHTATWQDPSKTVTPFFCWIEDEIARSSKVNFKFRLGSVQYVDALEGKAYFEAVGYSRATNFMLRRADPVPRFKE